MEVTFRCNNNEAYDRIIGHYHHCYLTMVSSVSSQLSYLACQIKEVLSKMGSAQELTV